MSALLSLPNYKLDVANFFLAVLKVPGPVFNQVALPERKLTTVNDDFNVNEDFVHAQGVEVYLISCDVINLISKLSL